MRARHLVFAAPVLLVLLAGCLPTPDPSASGTPSSTPSTTPTATASASPTASATPTATPTPEPGAIPLSIACGDLVNAQVFYDYNPNFSLLDSYTPDAGTAAASAVAAQGVACRWVNNSSGETIDISAARLPEPRLSEAKAAAGASVDDFEVEGYFSGGVAQAFNGEVWVAAASASFGSAPDAAPLVNAAISAVD